MHKPKLIMDITPDMMNDPDVRKELAEIHEECVRCGEEIVEKHGPGYDAGAHGARDENGNLRLPR